METEDAAACQETGARTLEKQEGPSLEPPETVWPADTHATPAPASRTGLIPMVVICYGSPRSRMQVLRTTDLPMEHEPVLGLPTGV